ncbi:alpha/beta hydrolase [Brachybacterium sp. FME24]|uniref:alpha/beta hydrolase n=1 Tax=Brachybacterium sp. FME24 TaxID=2742605 RepID=UPI001867E6F4|nr:alpha/beta hydrolase [Brachybacterium sp. FME24]
MPYGYLVTILIWGLATAAMLRPPRRPIWIARGVYFLSVVLNELPLLGLILFALATAQALLLDNLLSTPFGPLALAAAALVATGMIALQVSVARARRVIVRTVGVPVGSRPFRGASVLPFLRPTRLVERISNIPYAPGGQHHLLDLSRRRDLTGPAPVLIYLHGGGYVGGDKHFESGPLRQRMAQRGWIVLSANYSLRPQSAWPEHLVDVKRVLAWVHAHAEEFDMDGTTLVVAGSSAGSHLAVHAALTANQPDLQPGFEDVDTRISAVVGLYGYYGRYYGRGAEEHPTSAPLDLPADEAPPVVLFHGDQDTYVPVQQARDLVAHLRGGSHHAVAYAELPGAQHGFDVFASPRNRAVLEGVEHFLDQHTVHSADRR